MPIYRLGTRSPAIDARAFVHPEATIIGDVSIGPFASVWPGAVLRGDYGRIVVGARTSVQDGTVIHATEDDPTTIGAGCVIGHLAHLEGCIVEDDALVGSGAVVLHRAIVHSNALVAAHATVTRGTEVPAFAMALGTPARIEPNRVAPGAFAAVVERYVANAARYQAELVRIE